MTKPRLTGVIDIANAAALRALDIQLQDNDKVYLPGTGFYDFDPASLAQDDGTSIIKPTSVAVTSPGRWVRTAGSSASYKYTKEWHVDPVNGLDTNDGSEGKPFKTVARAATAIVGSGDALYLHAGTYLEVVTWTDLNVDIIGASTGGLTSLQGAWTFAHTGSSVRVRNVAFSGGVSHSSNSGSLYFNECQCAGTFTKLGAGYLEIVDCDFGGTGFLVEAAGVVNLINTKVTGLTVNNATAAVNVQGSTNLTAPTLLAGTLAINGSTLFSTSGNTNAVTSSPGTTILLRNSSLFTPQGTAARLSAGGFYSLDDVLFDSANSNFAGTNIGAAAHFDALTAINKVSGSSLSVPWSLDKAFDAAVIVEKDGALYKSNSAIPKNTPFAVGTAGATWSQISGGGGGVVVSGTVIDNTIANSDNITTVGRYIVPASGLAGAFVGQANQYADWYGETDAVTGLPTGFAFAAPSNSDKVVITAGANAGKIFAFDGATWTLEPGTADVPSAGQLLTITNLSTITSAGNPDSPWSNVAGGQFTIPGAGRWDVEYTLSFTNSTTNWVQTRIVDSSGAEVFGSRGAVTPSAGNPISIDGGVQVEIQDVKTYFLQARTFNGSTITVSNPTSATGVAAQRGQSVIRWTKAVEFPPVVVDPTLVVPQNLSRLLIGYTGITGVWPNGGTAPIGTLADPNTTGARFTLSGNTIIVKAGSRVRLTGPSGGVFGTAGYNRHYWALNGQTTRYNPAGGHAVDGVLASVTDTNLLVNQQAILEFTPTSDVTLQLFSVGSAGSFQLNADHGVITCEELPQMTVTGTVDTALTPINDQSASGYFDIGTVRYQWGRSATGESVSRTITLPAPFRDSSYALTFGTDSIDSTARTTNIMGRTATTFQARSHGASGTSSANFDWIAIGRKP